MKRTMVAFVIVSAACAGVIPGAKKKKPEKAVQPSILDQYLASALGRTERDTGATPGAIWTTTSRLPDFTKDPRASQVDDVVTVVVTEAVNAVASGISSSSRTSAADASINSIAGPKSAAGALANLVKLSGNQKLDGSGTTSRTATLKATISARVAAVLPGGMLFIEGDKNIQVNSEQQSIVLRGVIRTSDISTINTISSTQVADMEIRVNGKGIVADAVRRPNILYRVLMGLLPF